MSTRLNYDSFKALPEFVRMTVLMDALSEEAEARAFLQDVAMFDPSPKVQERARVLLERAKDVQKAAEGRAERLDGRVRSREQLRYWEGLTGLTDEGQKYIAGKVERIGTSSIVGAGVFLTLTLGFTLMMGVIYLFVMQGDAVQNDAESFIGIIVFVLIFDAVALWVLVRAWRDYQRLNSEGKILIGEVVSSQIEPRTSGSGKSRRTRWVVEVTYSIETPEGKLLTKTHDLPTKSGGFSLSDAFTHPSERYKEQLIAPRTPVAVIYVDDNLVRLL
jgi:hypothetical protein